MVGSETAVVGSLHVRETRSAGALGEGAPFGIGSWWLVVFVGTGFLANVVWFFASARLGGRLDPEAGLTAILSHVEDGRWRRSVGWIYRTVRDIVCEYSECGFNGYSCVPTERSSTLTADMRSA